MTSATSAPGEIVPAAADHRRSPAGGGRRGGGPHFLVLLIHIYVFLGCFYIYERYESHFGQGKCPRSYRQKTKIPGLWDWGKCLRKRGGSFPESFCLSRLKEHL